MLYEESCSKRNEISGLLEIKNIFKVFLHNWNEDPEFGNFLHKGSAVSESLKKFFADLFEITVIQDSP